MTSTTLTSTAASTTESTTRAVARTIVATPSDMTSTIARLALGVMILPHGMQKLFGSFGGYGFEGTMGFFTGTMGIPWALAFLAIVAEFFGGLGLITGTLGRVAALGVGSVMGVALLMHLPNGFFMNWNGQLAAGTEGIEFHILAIALALIVVLRGSGALSVDRLLVRK